MDGVEAMGAGLMIADTTAVAWIAITYLIALTWLVSGWMR